MEQKKAVRIEIRDLTKRFGDTTVLERINMVLESGHIYGFVGRNGSGKTMLMKHICGFVRPTQGSVSVNGRVVGKDIDLPEDMGIIIESPGFLAEYSAYQNLRLLALLRGRIGKREIEQAIARVGLDPKSKKHVGKYSLGMRQRLGLAQALMEDPSVLLLDEPMNGLDNEGAAQIRELLLECRDSGKLIVIASHTKEDIDLLCDAVYRMDHGRLLPPSAAAPCP